jgi:hypothetical protein
MEGSKVSGRREGSGRSEGSGEGSKEIEAFIIKGPNAIGNVSGDVVAGDKYNVGGQAGGD